jgi:hypothetical protein
VRSTGSPDLDRSWTEDRGHEHVGVPCRRIGEHRARPVAAGAELQRLLAGPDVTVESLEPGYLEVRGLTAAQIGDAAAEHGVRLHELTPQQASLEEPFMNLTREDIEYKAAALEVEEAAA